MKLAYQVSGRRLFYVLKRPALGAASVDFKECQGVISGEGASLPLSPRRLRAKYTLRTNLRFMLRGISPCRGQIHAGVNFRADKSARFIHASVKAGTHGWRCRLWLHFRADVQQRRRDFEEAPLRLSESDSRGLPRYGHWFADSRPVAAAHKETAADYPPKERRRYLLRRNSFIEMAKLHNLSGRITYISSHAKQEQEKYGVECFAALHHNKRKTNLHIHMIFAERKRLEQPEEKTATRNMFYDEHGKHVRTKKEILDGDGNVRKGCKIIKKGEVYERKIFTIKDGRFKQESFLDEAKVFYTDLINQMVLDDKDRLSIFDKNGPYLATKKVGKNNPKAEEIKADNEIRIEWNRAVDRAIVSGISETEIVELKKTEITDKVKESVEQNGSKPELFGDIVTAAVALLERLIAKVMRKVMDLAEKVIDKAVDAVKETSKETESHIHAKDESAAQPERKKIPFPVNPHRKADVRDKAEQSQQKSTAAVKKSIIEQLKAEKEPVPVETGQTAERPP